MLNNRIGEEIFKSNAQKYGARINIVDSNEQIDEEDIAGLSIETIASDKMIGAIASKFLSFTLFNASRYNLTEETVSIEIDLKDEDLNQTATYQMGNFKIIETTSKDIAKDEVVIKARDLSYSFTKEYKLKIESPKNIEEIIQKIAEDNNMDIVYEGIKNLDYTVNGEFYYKDYLLSSLLKEIAEATASNIYINNQEQVVFKPFKMDTVMTLEESDIFELSVSDIESSNFNTVVSSRIENSEDSTTDDMFYPEEFEGERIEYKIIGNNLIDDDRLGALPKILEGIEDNVYKGVSLETKGAPFLEPFDKLFINSSNAGNAYAINSTLNLSQGITTIESTLKTRTETDYESATKGEKILRTEIKVNKALGKITSVVNDLEEEKERLTEIEQTVENVSVKVETIGGSNLIKDSVLFGYRGELKNNWSEENELGEISTHILSGANSVASHGFTLKNKTINHTVEGLDISNLYSFSIKVNKGLVGSGKIKLFSILGEEKSLLHTLLIEPNEEYDYKEIKIEGFSIESPTLTIEYSSEEDGEITFTDNILNVGKVSIVWTIALGEIMGVNTQFNNNGLYMIKEGTENKQTLEISPTNGIVGKYNDVNVFELSEDKTISDKFIAKNQIEMGVIKIVPINTGDNKGWAFVDIGGF